MTVFAECESAIVVTAAHPDSMHCSIECNGRNNDPVEVTNGYPIAAAGLPDTESIANDSALRREKTEVHLRISRNDRNVNALATPPCRFDETVERDLVALSEVDRNAR